MFPRLMRILKSSLIKVYKIVGIMDFFLYGGEGGVDRLSTKVCYSILVWTMEKWEGGVGKPRMFVSRSFLSACLFILVLPSGHEFTQNACNFSWFTVLTFLWCQKEEDTLITCKPVQINGTGLSDKGSMLIGGMCKQKICKHGQLFIIIKKGGNVVFWDFDDLTSYKEIGSSKGTWSSVFLS